MCQTERFVLYSYSRLDRWQSTQQIINTFNRILHLKVMDGRRTQVPLKNWQSENDLPLRRNMIVAMWVFFWSQVTKSVELKRMFSLRSLVNQSKQLLYKDRPTDAASARLIQRIEMSLYRSASSYNAYTDLSTLKDRIKAIVLKNEKSNHSKEKHSWQTLIQRQFLH